MIRRNYRSVFHPERIILVGASNDPFKFGGMFLSTQLGFGYKGAIFPVNPKGGDIQGIKAYSTIDRIPSSADLAVIAVPAEQVMDAVKACIKRGVKGIQVLSAGFRESGEEGAKMEQQLADFLKAVDVALIGPNCFGIYSPKVGLSLLPGIDFPSQAGNVGFFSQSGGGASDVVYGSAGRGVRFSLVVSYGNAAGINAEELLEYFAEDDQTRVVGGYVEGVADGKRFLDALRKCAERKPVILYKSGLSELGMKGAAGHTGSMSGSKQVWTSVIRSAGAVMATSMADLIECIMAFNCLDRFSGDRAGVFAGGGARVVEALDAASRFGFSVPDIDQGFIGTMKEALPSMGARAGNPVDLANPFIIPHVLFPCMDAMAEAQNIDLLVLYQMLFYPLNTQRRSGKEGDPGRLNLEFHEEITSKACQIRQTHGKPLVSVLVDIASDPSHFEMEQGRWKARKHYTDNGIPCFDDGFRAFSVLSRVGEYYRRNSIFQD